MIQLYSMLDVVVDVQFHPHPPTSLTTVNSSEEKLTALKDRLASEIDVTASTLPTIVADSMDDAALERMVSQAKVCAMYIIHNK